MTEEFHHCSYGMGFHLCLEVSLGLWRKTIWFFYMQASIVTYINPCECVYIYIFIFTYVFIIYCTVMYIYICTQIFSIYIYLYTRSNTFFWIRGWTYVHSNSFFGFQLSKLEHVRGANLITYPEWYPKDISLIWILVLSCLILSTFAF